MADPDETEPAADESDAAPDAMAMLGPARVGKTSLLASLKDQQKGLHSFHRLAPLFSEKSGMQLNAAESIRQTGGIAQATRTDAEPIDLEISHTQISSGLFSSRRNPGRIPKTTIRVLDGAGGIQFPSDPQALDREDLEKGHKFRERAGRAQNLVICLPFKYDPYEAANVTSQLNRFIDGLDNKRARASRYAFALTMFDSLFIGEGPHALAMALDRELTRRKIVENLGHYKQSLIIAGGRLDEDRIRVFPVSAHGFVKGNGCPNTDRDKLIVKGAKAYDSWQPFFTVDPFMYLHTGSDERCHLAFGLDELELDR